MQAKEEVNQQELHLRVAEDFHSLQGEGLYTGTPMHFIRLAGCSVGRPQADDVFPIKYLRSGRPAWNCCTYDGRPFQCDTDFGYKYKMTLEQVISTTWEKHICVTGGEPLNQGPAVKEIYNQFAGLVHIETSGTIPFPFPYPKEYLWVTVSPKKGCLPEMIEKADELKLLVDKDFSLDKLPEGTLKHPLVFVQPVNRELGIDRENLQRCVEIVRLHPHWRISVQLHKVFNWR